MKSRENNTAANHSFLGFSIPLFYLFCTGSGYRLQTCNLLYFSMLHVFIFAQRCTKSVLNNKKCTFKPILHPLLPSLVQGCPPVWLPPIGCTVWHHLSPFPHRIGWFPLAVFVSYLLFYRCGFLGFPSGNPWHKETVQASSPIW